MTLVVALELNIQSSFYKCRQVSIFCGQNNVEPGVLVLVFVALSSASTIVSIVASCLLASASTSV